MKHGMKLFLAIGMITVLICASCMNVFAAGSLSHSHYSFDDGAYSNSGSSDNGDKTGSEVGAFDSGLLANAWIEDHTATLDHGLGKGFSSTNAVAVPNDGVTFAGGSFTVSAWFACTHIDGRSNAGTVQRIVSNGGYGDIPGWYISVLVQNNGNTFVGVHVGEVTEFIDVTATKGVYLNNAWHNIVMVADRENDQCHLYLDGELLKTMDVQDEWYNDGATNAYIGGYLNGETLTEGFCGFISDVQAVNRAASAEQIANYCGASVTDSTIKLANSFPANDPVEETPTTGDMIPAFVALAVLSGGCIVVLGAAEKKNRK